MNIRKELHLNPANPVDTRLLYCIQQSQRDEKLPGYTLDSGCVRVFPGLIPLPPKADLKRLSAVAVFFRRKIVVKERRNGRLQRPTWDKRVFNI